MGSQATIIASLLDHSLQYRLAVGPDRIQKHRQSLMNRLHDALPKPGLAPITPEDSKTALVSFCHHRNARELRNKMDAEKITLMIAQYHPRISPSVFNDLDDIERLVLALG